MSITVALTEQVKKQTKWKKKKKKSEVDHDSYVNGSETQRQWWIFEEITATPTQTTAVLLAMIIIQTKTKQNEQ